MKTTNPAPEKTPNYGRPTHPAARKAGKRESQTRPALAPFAPDVELFQLGIRLADQVFSTGQWGRLRQIFADANSADEGARRRGLSVLYGLAVRGAKILEAVESAGHVRFSGMPPTAECVVYAMATSINHFLATLNSITDGMSRVSAALPGATITEQRAARADGPVDVRVVGMPARVTETTVDRNAAGDIVSSSQISTDFKAPAHA